MNAISKICFAAIVSAAIMAGTAAANADVKPGGGARDPGQIVALNPQPLPPLVDPDDDFEHFWG